MNCLPLALAYRSNGWSVIPVGANKRPVISSWKEFQTRIATEEEVMKWWSDNPDAQIGIVTGKVSDLTVVDVESDGDFELIKDETLVVQTGGGGRHYYFKYDPDFTNMVRVLPSVDIRSEGGYVVGIGSTTQKGAYSALNTLKTSPISSLTKKTLLGAKMSVVDDVGVIPRSFKTDSYIPKEPVSFDYQGFGKGQRNDQMTRFIGSVLAKLHPSLWNTMGWDVVSSANQKNQPPLTENELKASFRSIANREGSVNPGGRVFHSRAQSWGPEETVPVVEENLSGEKKVERAVLLHASEAALRQEIDTDTAFPIDMKPFDDALLGGFSPGELIVVAGKTGTGKTTIMQAWTVTLATGGETKHAPLPALWFSYEVLVKPLWQKFQSMGADDSTPIYLPSYNESGDIEWVTEMIEEGIREKGIKIVAIDHLGFLRAPKGNYANASDAITHTVRFLKRMAVKYGIIIMLPVHMRKTMKKQMDTDDIRDSVGIAQEADSVFFIDREKKKDGTYKLGSKLGLLKNRKTGVSVSEHVSFYNGRFYYEPEQEDFDDKISVPVEVKVVETPIQASLVYRQLSEEILSNVDEEEEDEIPF